MIPTVLVVAFLIGRWWCIPAAAFAWAVLIASTNNDLHVFMGAFAFGAANAAVGFAARLIVVAAVAAARGRFRALG
jgi:hypothetical protein